MTPTEENAHPLWAVIAAWVVVIGLTLLFLAGIAAGVAYLVSTI